MSLVLEK